MLLKTAIETLSRFGEVQSARRQHPLLPDDRTVYWADVNGWRVSFVGQEGKALEFGLRHSPFTAIPVLQPTLAAALRSALCRFRRVANDTISAGVFLYGQFALTLTARFRVMDAVYERDDSEAVGMAESWLREEIPVGILLDWLAERAGGLLAQRIDECRPRVA
jgi:hypothetical protein